MVLVALVAVSIGAARTVVKSRPWEDVPRDPPPLRVQRSESMGQSL